ncbi:MAG: hypothetical protein IJX84_11245 [Clostridia bacterium]|nr:hypothetical protein [Clostridia bacterium]
MCEKNKKPQETIELTDDQLEDVAGGADGDTKMRECSNCKQKVPHEYRGGELYCTVCGKKYWNDNYSALLRPVITR